MKQGKKSKTLFGTGRMTAITYLLFWKFYALFFQVLRTVHARMWAILTKKYAKLTGWHVSVSIPIDFPAKCKGA